MASDQKPWAASRSPFPQCAKARNRRRPGAPERIAIAGQGEGFQGEGFDALGVALELRLGGSIQGDRTRQPLELSFVRHDHRPGRDRLVFTLAGCRFQPSLGALQERFDVGDLAMGHERSDIPHAQDRPDLEELIGKHLEPRSHRRFLARPSEARDRQLDQVRGSFEVLPRERVTNGVVPSRRSARTTDSRAGGGHGRGRAPRA